MKTPILSSTALLLLLVIDYSSCARILCVFPLPFYSHQSVFQPIWKELALRGHDVTVITPNPLKNSSITTLKEIDISFTYKLVFEDLKGQEIINTQSNILILMKHFADITYNGTIEHLNYPPVKALLEDKEARFDLLIAEIHIPAWFALAKKYNCPLIAITSMEATAYMKYIMGNVNNPILNPHINMPFVESNTFLKRLSSVAFDLLDHFQTLHLIYYPQDRIMRNILNDSSISLYEIATNISILFTTNVPGLSRISPTIPSIIELNGLHIKAPRPLPQEIQNFLDGATHGAIYFSLGSSVKSYLISPERRQIFIDIFKELPFRVLWKFEGEIEGLPPNVKIVSWTPQQDVLRHRNVRLFMTQGGLQSVDESIRFNVPMIGFPFFADQFYNLNRVALRKLGICLDFKTVTRETLREAILEVTGNQLYKNNIKEVSDLLGSHPVKSLNKAINWIEYVIKYKGARFIRSPLFDVPAYQYYLLDVLLFVIVFFVLTTIALVKCFNYFKQLHKRRNIKIKRS